MFMPVSAYDLAIVLKHVSCFFLCMFFDSISRRWHRIRFIIFDLFANFQIYASISDSREDF